MERTKTPKLVITFPTTNAAMTMDAVCVPDDGRLIPIPQIISAGCGLAWCAPPDLEEKLLAMMHREGIPYEQKQVIPLY